jgi:hypothetical protein
MLLQMVYCCVASVLLSIDPSIVTIKKLIFRPCAHFFRYVSHKYVDDKSAKGRIFGPNPFSWKAVNKRVTSNRDFVSSRVLLVAFNRVK